MCVSTTACMGVRIGSALACGQTVRSGRQRCVIGRISLMGNTPQLHREDLAGSTTQRSRAMICIDCLPGCATRYSLYARPCACGAMKASHDSTASPPSVSEPLISKSSVRISRQHVLCNVRVTQSSCAAPLARRLPTETRRLPQRWQRCFFFAHIPTS